MSMDTLMAVKHARELGALTDRVAKGLQQLGVKPGVHVGLFLPNTPHYVIAFFGVLKAGGTVVNYSPLDAAKVLQHKIDDSRTDFLFTLDLAALYPQMAGMLGTTRLRKLIEPDPATPRYLQTVWGFGYVFIPDGETR